MLAFVTGSTGFIGLNLIEQLTAAGWNVVALHRPNSDLSYLLRFNVQRMVGDIVDLAAVERAMPKHVDAVFHTAADLSSWSRNNKRQTQNNIIGTQNVVTAALNKGARRFVHTSTSSVYGLISTPVDETAAQRGRGSWLNYVHTKTLAEAEVRNGIERGLDAVILNPCHVIGRYDRHNWSRLILLAATGALPRIPPGSGSFCHAGEVARAHIAAVTRGQKGDNYLLGGADASFAEVVATAAQHLGGRFESRTVPAPILRLVASCLNVISHFSGKEPLITPEAAAIVSVNGRFRSDKAMKTLNYRPVPLREMVEDCCDWLVAEGLLNRTLLRKPLRAR
jgi:nucleoside-diphosphate-sugar epimerase